MGTGPGVVKPRSRLRGAASQIRRIPRVFPCAPAAGGGALVEALRLRLDLGRGTSRAEVWSQLGDHRRARAVQPRHHRADRACRAGQQPRGSSARR